MSLGYPPTNFLKTFNRFYETDTNDNNFRPKNIRRKYSKETNYEQSNDIGNCANTKILTKAIGSINVRRNKDS